MSDGDTEALPEITRTVGESIGYHADPEMSAIGYTIGGLLFLLLIPLLPFVLAIWAINKLLETGSGQAT